MGCKGCVLSVCALCGMCTGCALDAEEPTAQLQRQMGIVRMLDGWRGNEACIRDGSAPNFGRVGCVADLGRALSVPWMIMRGWSSCTSRWLCVSALGGLMLVE